MGPDGRLCIAVAASLLLPFHARADRTPAEATLAAAAASNRFDPSVVVPSPAVAEVRKALDAGKPQAARRIAEQAMDGADASVRPRLAWLLARAAMALHDSKGATDRLAALAASGSPLAPWAALHHAELSEPSDPAAAVNDTTPLIGWDWAGQRRARLIHARALADSGHADQAIPELRALVAETPSSGAAAAAAMPLADLLAKRSGDTAALEEALGLYRRVATRAPLTSTGELAERQARQVLSRLPADRRSALAELPVDDAFARAHALYEGMHHEQAEQAFAALATRLADDPAKQCEAELYEGKAMLRERKRDEAAKLLARVAAQCTRGNVPVRAQFLAARAQSRLGDNQDAIAQYALVEKEAPDSRLADDALFRAALAAGDDGDTDGMVQRLEALPSKYPNGDMRARARFMLAWQARAEGRWDDALDQLDKLIAEGPDEQSGGEHGRAAYWRARTLQDAGRTSEAVQAYADLVRTWPLSYYSQQALARLEELDPDQAAAERARFAPTGAGAVCAKLTFAHRAEVDDPAFRRALDLLRVGEVGLAMAELGHMGAIGAGADKDLLWLVAAVLDRAGAYPQASRLVRARLPSFLHTVPAGRARQLWRLAYPHAFAPLIDETAAQMHVPATYVRAVAREESAFDPDAVSVAHARGLIQLMTPTARRFARELGLPASAASLHDPEVNVRIGTKYIAYLWNRYADNPAVVPAAYNAGEHAADRWIRAHPDEPLDAWVEDIPYEETRRYTRKVLETWGVYRYLDDGELLTLSPKLPTP